MSFASDTWRGFRISSPDSQGRSIVNQTTAGSIGVTFRQIGVGRIVRDLDGSALYRPARRACQGVAGTAGPTVRYCGMMFTEFPLGFQVFHAALLEVVGA
jgi:hypothetical protein